MKLQELKITNLASLRGTHQIDFISLSQDGLFSIAGPTGSGKSTILNAISLSLFGTLYKKALNQNDLISLGASHAHIELIFRLKEKSYLASWESRSLKKDGTPLKNPVTSREFFEIQNNEKILIKEGPEDIIGLDYNQFSKTVILNQGEFARFLTSTFSERKDLLEKLCHLENLSLLGKTLSQETGTYLTEKNEAQAELSAYLSHYIPINPLKVALKETNQELKKINQDLEHQTKLIDLLKQMEKIAQSYQEKKKEQEKLEPTLKRELDIFEQKEESFHKKQKSFKEVKKEYDQLFPELSQKVRLKEIFEQKKEEQAKTEQEITRQTLAIQKIQKAQEETTFTQQKNSSLKEDLHQRKTTQLTLAETRENLEKLKEKAYLTLSLDEENQRYQGLLSHFLKKAQEIASKLGLYNNQIDQAQGRLKSLRKEHQKLKEVVYQIQENRFYHALQKILGTIDHDHTKHCPLCEQSLSAQDRARLFNRKGKSGQKQEAQKEALTQHLTKEHISIEKELADFSFSPFDLSELKKSEQRKKDLQKKLAILESDYSISQLEKELKTLEELDHLKNQEALLKQKNKDFQERIDEHQKDLRFKEELKQGLEQKQKALEKDLGKHLHLSPSEELNYLNAKKQQHEDELEQKQEEYLLAKDKITSLKEKKEFLKGQLKDLSIHYQQYCSLSEEIDFPKELKELNLDFFKLIKEAKEQEVLTLKEKQQEKLESKGNLNQKILTLTALKQKIDQTKKKLKNLEEILGPKLKLSELLARDEFRNFVLARVEEGLIKQTNFELKNLCDNRYELLAISHKQKTSDFYIKDRFRENKVRKVATLSGGETFMISLAMAMALSELSRGTAEIDSFFIDEGFATLDEDSLNDVMELLLKVQSRGKQVGVISHVEKLHQRIPNNLILQKGLDGNSHILLEAAF